MRQVEDACDNKEDRCKKRNKSGLHADGKGYELQGRAKRKRGNDLGINCECK